MAESSFSDTDLILSEDDSLQGTLVKWGNETITKLKKSLTDKTSEGTSGALLQSLIVLPVEFQGSRYVMSFKAEDYWKFINKGVRGAGGKRKDGTPFKQKGGGSPYAFTTKKPPVNFSSLSGGSLRQWAYNKGLNPFAVRESIFRSGTKATHFFDDVITQSWISELINRLEQSGSREIEIVFNKEFNNGK
jgi:hypothetical protein